MSEHLADDIGIAQRVPELEVTPQDQGCNPGLLERWRRWRGVACAVGAIAVLTSIGVATIEQESAQAATTQSVEIGMPVENGKWGSTASGQANAHSIRAGGQFAQDLFANGEDVYLEASGAENISFDLLGTWDSCGGLPVRV